MSLSDSNIPTVLLDAPDDACPYPENYPDFPSGIASYVGFTICDDDTANWLLNKIAALDERKARIAVQPAAMIAEADRDRENLMARFGPELEALALAKIAEQKGKTKTAKFLAGNVAFRTVPGGLRITDAETALKEALEHFAGFVQMVPKLDTTAYRDNATQVLETTGDLLPGCEFFADRESMSIKFPKKGDVV